MKNTTEAGWLLVKYASTTHQKDYNPNENLSALS